MWLTRLEVPNLKREPDLHSLLDKKCSSSKDSNNLCLEWILISSNSLCNINMGSRQGSKMANSNLDSSSSSSSHGEVQNQILVLGININPSSSSSHRSLKLLGASHHQHPSNSLHHRPKKRPQRLRNLSSQNSRSSSSSSQVSLRCNNLLSSRVVVRGFLLLDLSGKLNSLQNSSSRVLLLDLSSLLSSNLLSNSSRGLHLDGKGSNPRRKVSSSSNRGGHSSNSRDHLNLSNRVDHHSRHSSKLPHNRGNFPRGQATECHHQGCSKSRATQANTPASILPSSSNSIRGNNNNSNILQATILTDHLHQAVLAWEEAWEASRPDPVPSPLGLDPDSWYNSVPRNFPKRSRKNGAKH